MCGEDHASDEDEFCEDSDKDSGDEAEGTPKGLEDQFYAFLEKLFQRKYTQTEEFLIQQKMELEEAKQKYGDIELWTKDSHPLQKYHDDF